MGPTAHQPRKLHHQLEYYSDSRHKVFGEVPIYSSKALPMTFIMKLERLSEQSRLYNLYQNIQDLESGFLLTLFGFKI